MEVQIFLLVLFQTKKKINFSAFLPTVQQTFEDLEKEKLLR